MTFAETPASQTPPDRLSILRGEIDELDQRIVALVAQRTGLTIAVAEEKHRRGITTMVPGRHNEVVNNYMEAVPEDSAMDRVDAARLGEVVMDISRGAQSRLREDLERQQEAERTELTGLAEAAVRYPQQ